MKVGDGLAIFLLREAEKVKRVHVERVGEVMIDFTYLSNIMMDGATALQTAKASNHRAEWDDKEGGFKQEG